LIIIDVLGKPCPVPVIEAKKALAGHNLSSVIVKVDNIVAVQNLEKMASGLGYVFSYVTNSENSFDVTISKSGDVSAMAQDAESDDVSSGISEVMPGGENRGSGAQKLAVVIGSDTMGSGSDELGKILIKGFLYSLTELPNPPKYVIFFNSGAYLTSEGANTIDDLRKLEEKGSEIMTCGTCINYYGLQEKLAVGKVVNMYEITERLTASDNVVNI